MSLGYDRELNVVNLNDTAILRAFLYDAATDKLRDPEDIVSVSFTVQKPDKSKVGPTGGNVEDDGTGTLNFHTTDQVGEYFGLATFTLSDGSKLSVRSDFEVIDPFRAATPSASFIVAVAAWQKLEDCFDSEDEGPWLRDATQNFFNKDKMVNFINDALFDMNAVNPPTNLGIGNFVVTDSTSNISTATGDLPLLSQGVFIVVLRHLMRSYTEQPNPQGGQVLWHDRRDYLARWEQIYQIEFAQYDRMLKLYKRQFLGLGHTKSLVSAKAGRLIPAPMRTRFVGRGYW